jgi:hypothetical protein
VPLILNYYWHFTKVSVYFFRGSFRKVPAMFLITGILPKCWYFSRQFFKSACNVAYYWHLEKSAGISPHPAVIF